MEPYRPIKNYLPGKKIQIAIAIIIAGILAYFFVPRIVVFLKKQAAHTPNYQDLLTTVPDGDPTTRDTDSDGVPDWQEIAIGLDPRKPQTIAGTPDAARFEIFKNNLGDDLFTQAQTSFTDTDKLSLAVSNDINHSITAGSDSQTAVSIATGKEILNYIDAQKNKNTVYLLKDITVVADTLANNQAYAAAMTNLTRDSAATQNLAITIRNYLDGGGSKQSVDAGLAAVTKTIAAMRSVPVPAAAATLHLGILNGMQGIHQTVSNFVPDGDETARLGSLVLVQDYAIQMTTNIGKLPIYFSVALDSAGYAN